MTVARLVAPLLLILAAASAAAQQPPASGPPQVVVAPATERAVHESVDFVGRVQAVNTVELRARIEGFLTERNFTEGDFVDKDELLFLIQPEQYKAAVEMAEAQLSSAQARKRRTELEVERQQTLRQKGAASQAALDDATTNDLEAKAQVQEAEANLTQAKLNLSYTKISAPFDGRIGMATYSVGNLVSPSSQPLATVVQLDPIYAEFGVSETDIVSVMQEHRIDPTNPADGVLEVSLILPNGKPYRQTGKITFINNEVDPRTGTVTLRATFPNPNRVLLPGQYVSVTLSQTQAEQRLTIPQAAVQLDQAGHFVLTLDDQNKVQRTPITVGKRQGAYWVVDSGLKEGQMVIVQGQQKVTAGAEVNPVPASADDLKTEDSGTTDQSADATKPDDPAGDLLPDEQPAQDAGADGDKAGGSGADTGSSQPTPAQGDAK